MAKTDKLVELTLLGDLDKGVGVTVKVREEGGQDLGGAEGRLPPPHSALIVQYERWQSTLRSFASPGTLMKGKIITKGYSTIEQQFEASRRRTQWHHDCSVAAQELGNLMNSWLEESEFSPILNKLNETVSTSDRVRVLLCSSKPQVKKLPWNLWSWLQDGRQAEVILSTTRNKPQTTSLRQKVRILIILGQSEDINPETDLQILIDNLHGKAEIIPPLVNPTRQEVNKYLWDQNIDILFFAGHSKTYDDIGQIYINDAEFIEIDNLKYALQEARSNGLKLAIFNSCDGLGLAYELEDLYIPNLIVMRDIVHEKVAQQFLSDLLRCFVIEKKPLHLAELEARRRLQGLETEFPCASWMPVIFQNSSEQPQFWQNWFILSRRRPRRQHEMAIASSVIVTLSIMLGRSLGMIEPLELKAYDLLMERRPPEQIDERLLLVTADETDMRRYGKPLLSDAILDRVLKKLEQYQPRAIGLDVFRPYPVKSGHDNFDLTTSFKHNHNLINVCSQSIAPSSAFSEKQLKEQVGFADFYQDENDNVVRRQVLWQKPLKSSECPKSNYAFSLLLANRYLEAQHQAIDFSTGNLRFGTTSFKRLAARTGGYQRLNRQSEEILLNFRSSDKNGRIAQTVPIRDVLADQVDPKFISDKVVLIGVTGIQLPDDHNTPYGPKRGLWIHAQMVSAILSAVEDDRKPIWVLPQFSPWWGDIQWGDALWVWVWSFIAGLLAWRIPSLLASFLAGCVLAGFVYEVSLFILTLGGWMPLFPSILSLLLTWLIVVYIASRSQQQQ